jgi:glycosyltransferase involved in cell wall biosynthesis
VFRVVENLARGLVGSPNCDVVFYAGKSIDALDACLEYLRSNPEMELVPVLHSRWQGLRKWFREHKTLEDAMEFGRAMRTGDLRVIAREGRPWQRALRKLSVHGDRWLEARLQSSSLRAVARADIFHSPFYAFPEFLESDGATSRFLTVYDLVPVLFPELLTSHQVEVVHDALNSLTPEDWVICISQSTKDDLCDHAGVDPARVFVTPLAASPQIFYPFTDADATELVRKRHGIPPGDYVLALNTLEPRKNTERIVRGFARLIQQQGIADLLLVLVGAEGWHYDAIYRTISECSAASDRVILAGYVPDPDLAPLYSGAMMFVYPSLYEGFGLPPLEAMQCGTPVITSNTSSLPEVVGDAGIMVDPRDENELCQAMLKVYSRPSIRATMSSKSQARANQFSWERCTRQTIAAYRKALNS